MARPIYESDADLERERAVALRVGALWKCEVLKLPKLWPCDYCGVRMGKVEAWIEIKNRNYNFAQLDALGGYMMGVTKVIGMNDLLVVTQKPVMLCVNLTDGLYFYKYKPLVPYATEIRGRVDRGDPADMEPCVMFPMNNFEKLANAENRVHADREDA